MDPAGLVLIVLAAIVAIVLFKTVRIVPQATVFVIERLGKYSRTLEPGIHLLVPAIDRVRTRTDIREQVVGFPPQAVITRDNLVVGIDSVIYYSITDPASAQYKIENVVLAIEQLVVTTLRNVVGGMQLEKAVDLGVVTSATGEVAFLGIASIGFDSDVQERVLSSPARLGRLVYLYGSLATVASWRHAVFTCTVDGEPLVVRGWSVAVANSGVYGGGMRLAPDASLTAGELDVVPTAATGRLACLRAGRAPCGSCCPPSAPCCRRRGRAG